MCIIEDTLDVVANVLDYYIVESEFKLQLCYCIHFGTNTLEKSMNPLILQWSRIVLQLFKNDGLGIR